MTILHRLLCLIAAMTLALSGASVSARAIQGPVAEIVICGDGGPETVHLDVKGNPVDDAACCECPKCLTLVHGLPAASSGAAPWALRRRNARPRPGFAPIRVRRHARPASRGPPVKCAVAGMECRRIMICPDSPELNRAPSGNPAAPVGQIAKVFHR